MECKVEGCTNEGAPDSRTGVKYLRRGMCRKHYERNRRNGDPTVSGYALRAVRQAEARRAVGKQTEKQCSVCKKTKPLTEYYSRGDWYYKHCKSCHADKNAAIRMQQRLDNPPAPRTYVDHGDCAFDTCTNKGRTQLSNGPEGWYCMAHYTQWDRNKELVTLKVIHKSAVDDKFRRCTSCFKVKTHNEFYPRTNGHGLQSTCKPCLVLRNRFNQLIREGRVADAATVWDKMPEDMKSKTAARLDEAQAA